MRKDRNVNVIVGKALGVLLKPELPKPRRNPLHGSPPRLSSNHRVTLALEARQGAGCIKHPRLQNTRLVGSDKFSKSSGSKRADSNSERTTETFGIVCPGFHSKATDVALDPMFADHSENIGSRSAKRPGTLYGSGKYSAQTQKSFKETRCLPLGQRARLLEQPQVSGRRTRVGFHEHD